MLRKLCFLLLICAVSLVFIAEARMSFGERTRKPKGRSAAPSRRAKKAKIAESDYLFLNNVTRSKLDLSGGFLFAKLTNVVEYYMDGLPDIDFDMGEIYSGQIPVDLDDPSRNMFFVFQPTINKPVKEVTIWFNGRTEAIMSKSLS